MSKKPIIITWVDSHSPGSSVWVDPYELNHKIIKMKSIGYVIKETKKTITLASSMLVNKKHADQVSGVMCIPKCSILKRNKTKY